VWQVPQGCPVCRAKLGRALVGDVVPSVRSTIPARNANAANQLVYPDRRLECSPRIAAFPFRGAFDANRLANRRRQQLAERRAREQPGQHWQIRFSDSEAILQLKIESA
jgi:hypothetical protein